MSPGEASDEELARAAPLPCRRLVAAWRERERRGEGIRFSDLRQKGGGREAHEKPTNAA